MIMTRLVLNLETYIQEYKLHLTLKFKVIGGLENIHKCTGGKGHLIFLVHKVLVPIVFLADRCGFSIGHTNRSRTLQNTVLWESTCAKNDLCNFRTRARSC